MSSNAKLKWSQDSAKTLFGVLIAIVLSGFFSPYLFAEGKIVQFKFPSFDDAVQKHCESNPFDCMNSGSVSLHALEAILKSFYKDGEKMLADRGFELASFEFCSYNPNACYVDVERVRDKKLRKHYREIKGSPFLITSIYPARDNWWRASNGERYQFSSHVFFYRELSVSNADEFCRTEALPGNKFRGSAARAIRKNPTVTFSKMLSVSKGSRAFLRLKAPSLLSEEYVLKFGLVFECLLTSSKGLQDKSKVVLRSTI